MTVDDIEGLDFSREKDAYGFYVKYAKCNGFVVRKDVVVRNVSGMIITRRFLCNRAGERGQKHLTRVDWKRDHRVVTRINCEAHLRIHYNEERLRWVVTSFEVSHNHELISSTHIHLFLAYRGMTDADKAQIDSLHSTGMQTCHRMGHMVANKGGYEVVGFIKKYLYNYFGKKNNR
ncbi:protein FAR1-RELATED SEQUENCE 5-like [Trifolium pratense]|uniref:protein FAR1-RELATED SEQUENCE 5-like n=1 Tax=Trifolium pratense TaxID=57577 RepID=UPI001E697D56|nr:protein FAR1-RELATED SEQUENCE 5-like [Trifolium pratense]